MMVNPMQMFSFKQCSCVNCLDFMITAENNVKILEKSSQLNSFEATKMACTKKINPSLPDSGFLDTTGGCGGRVFLQVSTEFIFLSCSQIT